MDNTFTQSKDNSTNVTLQPTMQDETIVATTQETLLQEPNNNTETVDISKSLEMKVVQPVLASNDETLPCVSPKQIEIYRSILEVKEYSAHILYNFSISMIFLTTLIIVSASLIFTIVNDATALNTYIYSYCFIFGFSILYFLYRMYLSNNKHVKMKTQNDLIRKFAEDNNSNTEHKIKVSNREYLMFLLEKSKHHIDIKKQIFEQINKFSNKDYQLLSFLKQNLHISLRKDFEQIEADVINNVKNELFRTKYSTP